MLPPTRTLKRTLHAATLRRPRSPPQRPNWRTEYHAPVIQPVVINANARLAAADLADELIASRRISALAPCPLKARSATTNPAPAVAPAPLAAPSAPTIYPAASPAHIGKVAVEAADHALGGRHRESGGRGRGTRCEQKSGKPERNYGFLHHSSLPIRDAMMRHE